MSIDTELSQAIVAAVKECNQSLNVATRIERWVIAMSEGDLSKTDIEEFLQLTLTSIDADIYEVNDDN